MKRVFLGIDLPKELKEKIEELKAKHNLKSLPIKLVEPENSHIALKFLGELPEEEIKALIENVQSSIAGFKGFEVSLNGLIAFPGFFKPRVLAIKIESVNLEGLAKKIFAGLDGLSFVKPEEKKYAPHITLGRIKDLLDKEVSFKLAKIKFQSAFMANRLQLFESQLTAAGPLYSILQTFELN